LKAAVFKQKYSTW